VYAHAGRRTREKGDLASIRRPQGAIAVAIIRELFESGAIWINNANIASEKSPPISLAENLLQNEFPESISR